MLKIYDNGEKYNVAYDFDAIAFNKKIVRIYQDPNNFRLQSMGIKKNSKQVAPKKEQNQQEQISD